MEELRDAFDRLRREVDELRASRERLALAAEADRRRIERDLHDGPQQNLIAFAVNLQLAARLVDGDPAAAKELLDEMGRDVEQALAATAQLAQRIYPPLLDASGLAAALRSAAAVVGIPAAVEVRGGAGCPTDLAATAYLCCLEALEQLSAGTPATVTVRQEDGALTFEIAGDGPRSLNGLARLRDRVEAFGGRVAVQSEPGAGTRVSGSLPLAR
jgi:signal transduction histidine kinase